MLRGDLASFQKIEYSIVLCCAIYNQATLSTRIAPSRLTAFEPPATSYIIFSTPFRHYSPYMHFCLNLYSVGYANQLLILLLLLSPLFLTEAVLSRISWRRRRALASTIL